MRVRAHAGLEIDGFTIGEKLHEGGFATIWEVTHPLYRTPLVMKVPKILDGYDGPTIVGFEVEQMILPRLVGPHVPRVIGVGDFAVVADVQFGQLIQLGDLLHAFRRNGSVPQKHAAKIGDGQQMPTANARDSVIAKQQFHGGRQRREVG